ncbi:MAG: ABC-F family ATP-binding cassette domain-containing protein [Mycoplasma sp.]
MSLLDVRNLSFKYGAKDIFNDVTFSIYNKERIGLVGRNGQGKSTLMQILSGHLENDSGTIQWASKVNIGYMDQHIKLNKGTTVIGYLQESFKHLYDLEAELVQGYEKMAEDLSDAEMDKLNNRISSIQEQLDKSDFWGIDARIKKISTGLGVGEFGWETDVSELSGGQRTKILLASLLLKNPEVLLLDEPTNYLDEGHIAWLIKFLQNYEHSFVVISHDNHFLNAITSHIIHVENKDIKKYTGNYDSFLKMYEMEKGQLEMSYYKQQKVIAKQEEFIAKNSARASTAKRAQSRQKLLDKVQRVELVDNDVRVEFNFEESRASSKIVYELKNLVIGYDGKALSKPLNFQIERGQKIAITGTNGIGKSTLIKTIIGQNKQISGEVEKGQYIDEGYFIQEQNEFDKITCFEDVYNYFSFDYDKQTQRFIRKSLARVGLKKEHVDAQLKMLSGGEQGKTRLCKIVNTATNVLILDEPTNHLDIVAKNALKEGLKKYKGTVLLVCHEPDFYQGLTDQIWNVEEFKI